MKFLENAGEMLERLEKGGAFIVASDGERANPMTIGWGSFGICCGKPSFSAMIRNSRFTKELLEKNPEFTVCFPCDSSYRSALAFCGSKSGRDYDKIKECSLVLTDSEMIGVPGIENCAIFECRVIFKTEMSKEKTAPETADKWYKDNDYHVIYTGEILNVR